MGLHFATTARGSEVTVTATHVETGTVIVVTQRGDSYKEARTAAKLEARRQLAELTGVPDGDL